ncbi:RNA-binding protein 6-like isoform X2 [Ranitomeya imitator]|uniref:RNA-binding protein 6-like isoform X2 n=2 Tax=Ranitomeya imitator TaxID=111125 RepID=UPI0037E953B0
MWDDPRQTPRFRGHFGESIPPLIPPGSKPRLRGRHPFHFQGGPCLPNTRFDSPGSAVMHRDMDGRWEEDTMPEEEPHLWRARSNTDYRDDDYRGEEVMDMRYREVGKPESEFRAHLAPDMDYRERAQRGPPDVDYRCEEGPTVAYRERFQPPPLYRERESLESRRRMQEELDLRRQEVLEHNRQRVTSVLDILLQQQQRQEMSQRARQDRETSAPSLYQESADRDLRFRKPDANYVDMRYMDQEPGLDYRERVVVDYSHTSVAGDYNTSENPQRAPVLQETAGVAPGALETVVTSQAAYDNRDLKMPGMRRDADYRETEKSDSDYRGRDCRDVKTVDSDYRGKKSADADYRDKELAAATETSEKKSAGAMKTQDQPKTVKNPEALQSVMAAPDLALASLPSTGQVIPFLSYDKPQMPPVSKVNVVQERAQSAAKREAPSEANKGSFPGKLDVDFRDRPKPEAPAQEAKERPSKVMRLTADSKEPCPSDQDLRSKEPTQGGSDQDFRTGKFVQKDEDLRAGKNPTSADHLQNTVLFDFLRLAAKELRLQQEKGHVSDETKGPAGSHEPQKPQAARTSNPAPAASSVKSAGAPSSMDFLGRQDADYRKKAFNDVDLRVGHGSNKKTREDPQPGSKDKDYRRTAVPDGATRIIWLDGLPTGASREDILSALSGSRPLPEHGVNLIGYMPGYSSGSVCVEFSLVEEAVGCMEANKGVLHFKGKKVSLKYKSNSDRWNCQQCKAVNIVSKERCWQCSALRAGSDHLPLRDAQKDATVSPSATSRRAMKRAANLSVSGHSPDDHKGSSPKKEKEQNLTKSGKIIVINGIPLCTTPRNVVKALQPFVPYLLVGKVEIVKKKRRNNQEKMAFIELRSHKEAVRLTTLIRYRIPPLSIEGKPVTMDLAHADRKLKKKNVKAATRRKRQAQKRSAARPGHKGHTDRPIYDPRIGRYVNPQPSNCENQRKNDNRKQTPGSSKKVPASRPPRRGFTEEKDLENDPFKRPLPPPVTSRVEPPPEPKDNPLIKLLGEYGDDSEEEEEELPPPRASPSPAPKPTPKPAAPSTEVTRDEVTDWKKMACLLCLRKFPNKAALIRHQKLSDLHKRNLAIQKLRKCYNQQAYLEQKEDEAIQRRLLQARRELERLERAEESAQQ